MATEMLQQVDVIVVDVSGSMKSRSAIDPDKTREDVSKLVFHTMVDKMLCLEMSHAVGLVAFGANVRRYPFTEAYETFHTELGRLDANEGSTKLYDAVLAAAEMLKEFQRENPSRVASDCPLRVFVLTDGEDNASGKPAWQVASALQEMNVTLDAFPMAAFNATLFALCRATGGLCVDVSSVEQGTALFEREALIHLHARASDPATEIAAVVRKQEDFAAIVASLQRSSGTASDATRSAAPARQQQQSINQPVSTRTTVAAAQASSAANVKRLLKEIAAMPSSPHTAHVCDSLANWKVVIRGPPQSPYEGGYFVLSLQFPDQYPFHPPRARMLTPVYHCNVNDDGAMCLSILRDAWSPALTVVAICDAIVQLLATPDLANPLDSMKATVLRDEPERYRAEALRLTTVEAMPFDAVVARYHLEEADSGACAPAAVPTVVASSASTDPSGAAPTTADPSSAA